MVGLQERRSAPIGVSVNDSRGGNLGRSHTVSMLRADCHMSVIVAFARWSVDAFNYFFSPSNAVSDDPLVDIVRRDPLGGMRFIRIALLLNSMGSLVVCTCGSLFLILFWHKCWSCDRPLRSWLLVFTFLQGVQVPIRFVMVAKMRLNADMGGDPELCISSLTASPAWRASKNVSLFTYGWFILGIVWAMNTKGCSACPGIYSMVVAAIIQAIARAIVVLVWFRFNIEVDANDGITEGGDGAELPKIEAAEPGQIALLPLVRFTKCLFSVEGASCAICLCDYELNESLRRLPCGHYFHRKCGDKWLRRNKRCPLCMRAIDALH